jgi:hypothetical protein
MKNEIDTEYKKYFIKFVKINYKWNYKKKLK